MKPWLIFAASDIGSRETNNDSFEILSLRPGRRRYYSIIISDGVGKDSENGDCAKRVVAAASNAARIFIQRRGTERPFEAADCLQFKFHLYDQLGRLPGTRGQAATLAMALFSYRSALVAWAGDSRIYTLLSDGTLMKLTDDHHDRNGDITRFILGNGDVYGEIEVRQYIMDSGIAMAGTTDGVHGSCSPDELRLFLIYCMANARFGESFLARDLRKFLQENLSDNATLVLACSAKSIRYLHSIAQINLI